MTFIVFEGGEGSGKSTQAKRLTDWMRKTHGLDVVLTFEPGDTRLGAQLRALLLNPDNNVNAQAELLLMLADRAQHVADVIDPALTRGAIVVCDRFVPSSLAYQGAGRGIGVVAVENLNRLAIGGLAPDLVLVLDVPEEVAVNRLARSRPDRLEHAGRAFHSRVRNAYRELAPSRGWVVIDGAGTPEEVEERVRAAVLEALPITEL